MLQWLFGRRRIHISIPNPCQENWDGMRASADGRFCEKCQHTVTDFSRITEREAARAIQTSKCGRVRLNERGEVVFRPEPAPRFGPLSLVTIAGLGLPALGVAGNCKVNVNITDASGAAVRASVAVQGVTGLATGSGQFSATVPAGPAVLQVTAPGFAEKTVTIHCPANDSMDVPVTVEIDNSLGGVIVTSIRPPFWKRWFKRVPQLAGGINSDARSF